ncbi:MAG: hypothetical protein QMB03_03420 [Spirosomataceae bacterium]
MKKIIYTLGLCFAVSQVSAQLVSGAALFVGEGAIMSINMDVVNEGEITNEGKMYFRENVENNGSIKSSGLAVFDGHKQQQLTGKKSTSFSNVRLDNDLELKSPMTVVNELSFRRGVISTVNDNTLTFEETAVHSGASDFSHVAGNVQKVRAESFEFPVGDGTNYRGFEVREGLQQTLVAEYTATNPIELVSNVAQGLEAMNEYEYWTLRSVGAGATKVKVNLAPSVYDYGQIAYLKKGTWTVSDDNSLSEAMGLNKGIMFTSGRGRLVKKDIGVWPNPTQDEFNLKLTGMSPDSEVVIDVVNQDGRMVMHLKGAVRNLRNVYELPQNLPTTELTIRVVEGEEVMTQKLVLNR